MSVVSLPVTVLNILNTHCASYNNAYSEASSSLCFFTFLYAQQLSKIKQVVEEEKSLNLNH